MQKIFEKSILKLFIVPLANALIQIAEKLITGSKKGTEKKDFVIKWIVHVFEMLGIAHLLNKDKMSKLIEDLFKKLINKT